MTQRSQRVFRLLLLPLLAAQLQSCNQPVPTRGAPPKAAEEAVTAANTPNAAAATKPPAAVAPGSMPADHCAQHPAPTAAAPLAGESLYQLHAALTDQHGASLAFDAFRGQPVLMTMFYASCTSICPMLIGHLQRVEGLLPPAVREQTRVVLVSLDPERDTVAQLQALATRHGVDGKRWHFVRTPNSSVQEIAALLGVRYRRMPDGEISHSPVIALLNAEGIIASRVEAPLPEPKELATALQSLAMPAH
jgi:protein SCO1/2